MTLKRRLGGAALSMTPILAGWYYDSVRRERWLAVYGTSPNPPPVPGHTGLIVGAALGFLVASRMK